MSLSEANKETSGLGKAVLGIIMIGATFALFSFIKNSFLYIINMDVAYELCRLNEFISTPFGKITSYLVFSYIISILLTFRLFKNWKTKWLYKFYLVLCIASIPSTLDLGLLFNIDLDWYAFFAITISIVKLSLLFYRPKVFSFLRSKIKSKRKIDDTYSIILPTNKRNVEIKNPFAGIYIQGGAGSGKTESLLKPMMKQCIENNFAFIIYDFKGELTPFAIEVMEAQNINQFNTLNFKEPFLSDRFNPLNPEYIRNTAEVVELTKTLFYNLNPASIKQTTNNYFLDEAINLFTSIVIFLKNNKPNYCTIPHIIAGLANNSVAKVILKLSTEFEALPYISSLKNVIELKAEKQVAGVIGSLQGSLAKFTSKELFYILSANDFSPELNNPESPNRLCIVNDSTLPSFYAPLISMIINNCLKKMNVADRHKSAIFLDEAPTLFIPEFEQIPATARSNKIATVFTTQDYTQILDKYGKEKAQTIISNLGSQFYGRTTNVESMKQISELFGKYDKVFKTKSKGKSSDFLTVGDIKINNGQAESIQQRYTVTSNELLKLKPGEFYSVIGDKKSHNQHIQLKKEKAKKENYNAQNIRKLSNAITQFDLDNNYIAINNVAKTLFD
ncbi:type IV secretory system conjugative DNA transfer family protein [Maribacter sp. BPC-D8]|uniref:type IV secretory system conjugative DNA transfer family protein n=1 Tax=Maribacter sp. BPC-D8 TaxID=3053613 RepID=UPI002B463EB1|nr:type IV secretory system conjugative DNA transfer family protein [Maribacter sp. BPC-D8]WRI28115.1 type IV secretory system conjugative DNA transfer family protein [Maribacter sp. BPC-D8]